MRSISLLIGVLFALLWHGDVQAACSTPAGSEGQLRYDSTSKQIYVCDNVSWKTVGAGWQTVPLTDTANFDPACFYKATYTISAGNFYTMIFNFFIVGNTRMRSAWGAGYFIDVYANNKDLALRYNPSSVNDVNYVITAMEKMCP